MKHNQRPTYTAVPYVRPETGERVPNHFAVLEHRNGEARHCFVMSNLGDRMSEILKRGIPADDAKTLFYAMDGS